MSVHDSSQDPASASLCMKMGMNTQIIRLDQIEDVSIQDELDWSTGQVGLAMELQKLGELFVEMKILQWIPVPARKDATGSQMKITDD